MSTANQTELLPFPQEPRRRLHPVAAPAPRKRPRLAYAIAALAGALAIAGAQMGLSIATMEGSYELSQLSQERHELTLQSQELRDDLAGLDSPQYLAANAASAGMVIDASPSYLRLSDGRILGTGAAAGGASTVNVTGKSSVGNELVTDTPLITDPDATIHGKPKKKPDEKPVTDESAADEQEASAEDLPPAITDGLPTPATH